MGSRRVVRRTARAILVDDDERVVLIRRVPVGEAPYWTAPGGGVESGDASVQAAMCRELREELGADVVAGEQVLQVTSPVEGGLSVQHFLLCRLVSLDLARRSGPEFADTARGRYELDFVSLADGSLGKLDLKPSELKDFIISNRDTLLGALARLSFPRLPPDGGGATPA